MDALLQYSPKMYKFISSTVAFLACTLAVAAVPQRNTPDTPLPVITDPPPGFNMQAKSILCLYVAF